MTTEYWAWFYLENPNQDEIEDTDFDIDAVTAAMRDGKDWQDL